MRAIRLLAALVILHLAFPSIATAGDLLLSTMIKEIQVALRDTQKVIKDSEMPALSSVELEMKTVQKDMGGGKVSLFIAEVGGKPKYDLHFDSEAQVNSAEC